MCRRGDAGKIEPGSGLRPAFAAICVLATVKDDGWKALSMRLQNPVDEVDIFHMGVAFFVNDDVIPLAPFGFIIDWFFGGRSFVRVIANSHLNFCSHKNPFDEAVLLLFVGVAAPADD